MDISLLQKHALVCGASKGIGRATAELFAEAGANVTLLARNETALEEVKNTLATDANQTHHTIAVDGNGLSNLEKKLAAHVANHPVDIVVNNSGGPRPGPANSANPEDFVAAFQQHLLCSQTILQCVLPHMQQQKFGRIINIISTSVKQPIPGLGVSNTVRGAVASWAKTLATELGPDNITVNNVLPGATDTERLSEIFQNKSAKLGKTVEQVVEEERAIIPLKRFANPRELASGILFLASELGSYVSGINLPIDGGRTTCL